MRRTHAALAFLLIVGAACDNPTPIPTAPGLDARTAQQLFERLDRLVAALESMPRVSAPVAEMAARAPERTLAPDANAELIARLEALEHDFARLRERTGLSASPVARLTVPPPMEPMAVQQCCTQLWGNDEAVRQEARRSLFQLTEQQVLQRLGTPTYSGIGEKGHVQWQYRSEKFGLLLTFVDGRVVVISQ